MSNYNYTITLSDPEKTHLMFQKINERIIIVNPTSTDFETTDTTGNITSIDYNGCYDININHTITLKNTDKYKIKYIEKKSGTLPGYYLYTHTCITKSTTFIMPFLGSVKDQFRRDHEFINCFIGTEDNNDYGDKIYLLYRFSGSLEYTAFESFLTNHPQFEKSIDIDQYQVLYQFKIPEEHKETINILINGKYSTISESAKERILKFNASDSKGTLYQILNKSEERRVELEKELKSTIPKEAEVYSIFDKKDEIFYNNLIIK
jgi:hypothetical protein